MWFSVYCVLPGYPHIARLWYCCFMCVGILSLSMFVLFCSAFSEYNMDQFTPAKVDRDQVSTVFVHVRVWMGGWVSVCV